MRKTDCFLKIIPVLITLAISNVPKSFAQSYTQTIDPKTNENKNNIIGFATTNLTNKKPEGLLGNFITDAVKNEAEIYLHRRIDVVFISSNAIKGAIFKGEVDSSKITEVLPFDDSLAYLEVDGSTLMKVLDRIASNGGAPLSGVKMSIRNMRATNVLIDGDSIIMEKKYLLLTIERNAEGNENFPFLKNISHRILPNTLTLTLIKYIKKMTIEGKPINAFFGHRISYN